MTAAAETTEIAQQSAAETEAAGASGVSLSPPPRAITPHVRRRALTEPHVRSWWLLAGVLLAIGAYVGGREYWVWSREVRLIRAGQLVDAEITSGAGLVQRWQRVPPNSLVTLRYQVDGKTYDVTGYLQGRTEYILLRSTIPVHVDPANPSVWTARTEPAGLVQQLTWALVVLPAFVAILVIGLWQRARLLRVWRDGEMHDAIVVDGRQTALAPKSRLLRCTPADAGDKRVVEVYLPGSRAADVRPGDLIRLIFPPGGRGRPVAAAWFE
jgi:hypothetical protein